jgi:hypothetical protein
MSSSIVNHFKCDACTSTFDVYEQQRGSKLPSNWRSVRLCVDGGNAGEDDVELGFGRVAQGEGISRIFDACSQACAGKLLTMVGEKLTKGV